MTDKEKLVEILRKTRYEYRRYIAMKDYEKRMAKTEEEFCAVDDTIVGEIPFCADFLIANGVTVQECARPLEEWREDYGDVLWWKFPIEEPPYVGSPLDEKWPAYHTHWTQILMPQPPKEGDYGY